MEATIAMDSQSTITPKIIHNEEAMDKDLANSTNIEGSTSESINSDNINGSDDEGMIDADMSDYDDDDNEDYMYEEDDNDDEYLKLQAQFDNNDLPPGVEASFSWSAPSEPVTTSTPAPSSVVPNFAAGTSTGNITGIGCSKGVTAPYSDLASGSSSSMTPNLNKEEEKGDDFMMKLKNFKRFDVVSDFSDHHYSNRSEFGGNQPPKSWTKKIQDEWKILEKDLPDTIFVRVYETRMELLRAVIVGPAGTPYHDGLFVFDVLFPNNYPDVPPMVYYYSGGVRLNPNLYDCGKVCLSLLNTWNGKGNEKWVPHSSTMLQVLVSIQALILNAEPFFNEPGYEGIYKGAAGKAKSKEYNEGVFILSLKTMTYTIRRPPMYFEDLVGGHFRSRARDICKACKAYMNGLEVGCAANESATKRSSRVRPEFKNDLVKVFKGLVSHFIKNGATELEEFRTNA
jgi:ubiquitin-conjugating enzyme E2 O